MTLQAQIQAYRQLWRSHPRVAASTDVAERFVALLTSGAPCFERSCLPGHVTGSMLVVSPDCEQVLLHHHAKLDLWIQLGGHADGELDAHAVATREVAEESGLVAVDSRPVLFDIDIHRIPARGREPEHLHYDASYLGAADPAAPIHCTTESKELRWLSLSDATRLVEEPRMLRQLAKVAIVRDHPQMQALFFRRSQSAPHTHRPRAMPP